MKTATTFLLTLLLLGCAQSQTMNSRQGTPDAEQLIANLSDADYVQTETCISTAQYSSVELIDDKALVFHDGRNSFWINRFPRACPFLRERETLVFDLHGNRVCRLDGVRTSSPLFGWWRPGPRCALGDFQRVSAGQAALLREIF
ncbi:MAG: DUF6491 family protein [Pseudomonadales bacterium]